MTGRGWGWLLVVGAWWAGGSATAAERAAIAAVPGMHALQVSGLIDGRFAARVEAALDAHPDIRVLEIHSRGGRLGEARKLATRLNARGIGIRVDGPCASACAVLWAATRDRAMDIDARLGLHRSRWPVPLPAPLRAWAEQRSDRINVRIFLEAGFSPAVALQAARTPPTGMYWIGALDLKRERVAFVLE